MSGMWRITTAWHEAGHAVMAILVGAKFESCHLYKYKRESISHGFYGLCQVHRRVDGTRSSDLITVAGVAAERLWLESRRDLDEDQMEPFFATLSMKDQERLSSLSRFEVAVILSEAEEILRPYARLIAWIARRMMRHGYVCGYDLIKHLPRRLRTRSIMEALYADHPFARRTTGAAKW